MQDCRLPNVTSPKQALQESCVQHLRLLVCFDLLCDLIKRTQRTAVVNITIYDHLKPRLGMAHPEKPMQKYRSAVTRCFWTRFTFVLWSWPYSLTLEWGVTINKAVQKCVDKKSESHNFWHCSEITCCCSSFINQASVVEFLCYYGTMAMAIHSSFYIGACLSSLFLSLSSLPAEMALPHSN